MGAGGASSELGGAIDRIKSTLGEGYRVVVLDDARYRDVTNTTGRGAFDTKNKVLYLNAQQVRNLDKDNVRAVYHEAIHPILTKRFGEASAEFVSFKQDLVNAINRSLSGQDAATLIARLEAFEAQYGDKTTEQQAEEFMTELGAIMASEDVELLRKSGLLNRIKELINNLLRKLGSDISLDTENDVVEFMNSLAQGVRGGVAVADIVGYDLGKEAKTLDELIDGEAGVAIGSTERTDFQESRKITIPKTDFTADIPQISLGEALEKYGVTEGDKRKRYAIITSDFTKVGYDSLNQPINGGIGFVAIKKNVDDGVGFASLEESTAKSLFTRLRNNYGDNKNVVVLVMLQSPSSTIGNHYGAKYMYRALRALKESVGEKAFRKAVSESIASKDVLKPMNKSGKTKEQVVDILAQVDVLSEEDFVNNLIFEEQLSFNFRREYGRRILHPTTVTKTGKKSKRTNTVAKELGELGFDMDGFLDEYAQKEFMIQGMLDTDRSSHVVAGFQVNTANKEDAESAVEQIQSRGILHGLFDGKVPAVNGTNFYLDGLYEVKTNFAKDFLEFAVPDKGTKERKRIDNYAKKKYGKVYTKLDSNDKIDVKDWATERGLTIELKPEESQRATDVARGIPAVSDRGVEIEPVMEEEAPLSESRREEANKALEKRLKGDSLLEAKDTLDELLDNNAEINSDGTVVVYHRSTEETTRKIVSSNEMFGLEDGVFFSTLRNGQAESYGDSVVKMSLPIEMIEIDDVFGDEAHVRIPTKKPNQKISIKKFNPVIEQEAPLVESRRFEVDINPIKYASPSFEKGAGRVFTVDGGSLEIAKGKESGAFIIMSLNVEEGKRRQGRAEALLSEALEYTEGKLTGMASNDSAVRLNYKLGMRSYYDPNLSLEETMKQRAKNAGGYMLMALPSYIQTVPKKQKTEKKEPTPRFSVGSLKSLIEKTSKTIEFGERMKQQHESGEAPMDEQGLTELNKILLEEKSKLDGYVKELEEHPLVESRRDEETFLQESRAIINEQFLSEEKQVAKFRKAGVDNKQTQQAINDIGLKGVKFTKEGIEEAIQKAFDDLAARAESFVMTEDSKAITGAIMADIEAMRADGASESEVAYAERGLEEGSPVRGEYIRKFQDAQRNEIRNWVSYLNQSDYNTSFKYLILDGVLTNNYDKKRNKYVKRDRKTLRSVTPFNAASLAELYQSDSKEMLKDYTDIQEKNAIALAKSRQVATTTEGEWIKYDGGRDVSNEDIANNASELAGLVSDTPWCTKTNAASQLREGDFYVYATRGEDGSMIPRIAIRMEGERVGEVRGVASEKQDLEPSMNPVAEKFLKENIPNDSGQGWLDSIEYNEKAEQLLQDINEKGLNRARMVSYFELLPDEKKYTQDYGRNGHIERLEAKIEELVENNELADDLKGKVIMPSIQRYSSRRIANRENLGNAEFVIGELELKPSDLVGLITSEDRRRLTGDSEFKVQYVSGDATVAGDVTNIKFVGGDLRFFAGGNPISVEVVGGDVYAREATTLGNLRKVGGNLSVSNLKDLGNLEEVVDMLNISSSNIKSLGNKIKSVGYLKVRGKDTGGTDDAPLEDFGSLEKVE